MPPVSTYKNKITKLNDSLEFQDMMSLEERRILEHNTEKRLAYEEGMNLRIEQGFSLGEKQKQLEIAKKLLKNKNLSIEGIIDITGLSFEEIDNLKNTENES